MYIGSSRRLYLEMEFEVRYLLVQPVAYLLCAQAVDFLSFFFPIFFFFHIRGND